MAGGSPILTTLHGAGMVGSARISAKRTPLGHGPLPLPEPEAKVGPDATAGSALTVLSPKLSRPVRNSWLAPFAPKLPGTLFSCIDKKRRPARGGLKAMERDALSRPLLRAGGVKPPCKRVRRSAPANAADRW